MTGGKTHRMDFLSMWKEFMLIITRFKDFYHNIWCKNLRVILNA